MLPPPQSFPETNLGTNIYVFCSSKHQGGLILASHQPYYDLPTFLAACGGDSKAIYVEGKALEDARNDFLLETKRDLLAFLSAKECPDLEFVNNAPWREAPPVYQGMSVDAYTFVECLKPGYFAFGFSEASNRWVLKSFHLDDGRVSSFGLAFEKAAQRKLEDKHE